MNHSSIGLSLMGLGLLLIIVGALYWCGALSWLGRLPGDIRFEGSNVKVYVPITSMLIISVVLSLIIHLARRLF